MSGRKDVLAPQHIIVAGSMALTLTSAVIPIQFEDNIGAQVVWSGTSPVGVIDVQCSLDGVTFDDLEFDSGTDLPVTGNSGSFLINMNQVPYPYIRIVYTPTSGVGSLNVYITAKQV